MNTPQKTSALEKHPYQKPQIERVRLVPQDAVLAVCRGVGKYGSGASGGCEVPPPAGCYAQGS